MLMSLNEVSRQLRLISEDRATAIGVRLTPDALDFLSDIPPQYRIRPTLDVNINELRRTIERLIQEAKLQKNRTLINSAMIVDVMANFDCHYLWFC